MKGGWERGGRQERDVKKKEGRTMRKEEAMVRKEWKNLRRG